jgi:hypothetical protein
VVEALMAKTMAKRRTVMVSGWMIKARIEDRGWRMEEEEFPALSSIFDPLSSLLFGDVLMG